MELLHQFFDFALHLDVQLVSFSTQYGLGIYDFLFLIIFCETGLVVFPFLPGDSLLFASGALAANSLEALNVHWLFILLAIASILGNMLNYSIGRFVGPKVFHSPTSWFLNKKYLERAHAFYETYGGKTIIIARFTPIIRSFAPFVAGVGYMSYRQFSLYNIAGAVVWVGSLLYISYLFGNLPFVKENFSLIIVSIIIISLLPPFIEIARRACIAHKS
jgi:membrane-associated protein